jgi:hypothetical protein
MLPWCHTGGSSIQEGVVVANAKKCRQHSELDELSCLRNVGPAVRHDLESLGINSVRQLAEQDPEELYIRLAVKTGSHQDPCVWDVFAAIVHEAKTGEKLDWWKFTPARKQRQKKEAKL